MINPFPNQPINIYSATLIFKKKTKNVLVKIRRSNHEKQRREEISIPEEIDIGEFGPHWLKYRGEAIVVYHRKIREGNYVYFDSKYIGVHEKMEQKLEEIVNKVYSKFYPAPTEENKIKLPDYLKTD